MTDERPDDETETWTPDDEVLAVVAAVNTAAPGRGTTALAQITAWLRTAERVRMQGRLHDARVAPIWRLPVHEQLATEGRRRTGIGDPGAAVWSAVAAAEALRESL